MASFCDDFIVSGIGNGFKAANDTPAPTLLTRDGRETITRL